MCFENLIYKHFIEISLDKYGSNVAEKAVICNSDEI
jgi:hypothetical protein